MRDPTWKNAIIKVLESADEPMRYTDIADEIGRRGLRTKLGATPAYTVVWALSTSIRDKGEASPFVRVSKGLYGLRAKEAAATAGEPPEPEEERAEETGLINAFGVYWSRDKVRWDAKEPSLWGRQLKTSTDVDFSGQAGVYLLCDGQRVVYIGRTTNERLGTRLREHTVDRLNSRWDRFSWFGVCPVSEDGKLKENPSEAFNLDNLIATMEALLIEAVEPSQNRKRGDDFRAVEFLQVEDPGIEKARKGAVLDELKKQLGL